METVKVSVTYRRLLDPQPAFLVPVVALQDSGRLLRRFTVIIIRAFSHRNAQLAKPPSLHTQHGHRLGHSSRRTGPQQTADWATADEELGVSADEGLSHSRRRTKPQQTTD